jgi:hypothetical protein
MLEVRMKFKSPMKVTWIIAVILGALGTLSFLGLNLPLMDDFAFIFVIAGWALLAVATVVDGI